MTDEPSRKKRGADNQLTQDNWQEDADGDDDSEQQSGPFKKAAAEELAKRRIVKARRSGSAGAAVPDVPTGPAAPVSKPAPASATGATGVFSWTQPVVSAEKGAAKDDEVAKETFEVTIKKSDTDAPDAKKDDEKKDDSPAKKPALPAFSTTAATGGFASIFGGGFGSGSTTPFTFGNAPPTSYSFGSAFGSASKAVGFGDVSSAGYDEDGEGEGNGEDAEKEVQVNKSDADPQKSFNRTLIDLNREKEVQVKKSDAVVQLEEVETCTGEEDETTAFQVRAKLFVLGAPTEDNKDGDDDQKEGSPSKAKSNGAESKDEKKDALAKDATQWVVVGIGNLKVNVPKPDVTDKSRRPRVIMRRQKTLQLCLNSYLFSSMICDRAGPKDVRFTGMKKSDDKSESAGDGLLATYLVRVKEEDQAQELMEAINKHKNT